MPYRERVGTSYPEINLGAVSRYLALLAANDRRWADAVGTLRACHQAEPPHRGAALARAHARGLCRDAACARRSARRRDRASAHGRCDGGVSRAGDGRPAGKRTTSPSNLSPTPSYPWLVAAQGTFPHTRAAEQAHLTVTGAAYEKPKIWCVLREGLRPEKHPPPFAVAVEFRRRLHTLVHTGRQEHPA